MLLAAVKVTLPESIPLPFLCRLLATWEPFHSRPRPRAAVVLVLHVVVEGFEPAPHELRVTVDPLADQALEPIQGGAAQSGFPTSIRSGKNSLGLARD